MPSQVTGLIAHLRFLLLHADRQQRCGEPTNLTAAQPPRHRLWALKGQDIARQAAARRITAVLTAAHRLIAARLQVTAGVATHRPIAALTAVHRPITVAVAVIAAPPAAVDIHVAVEPCAVAAVAVVAAGDVAEKI